MEKNTINDNIPSEEVTNKTQSVKQGYKTYTMNDLKRLVEMRYESFSEFGKKLNWTTTTTSVFLNGFWIPTKPEVIRKIAEELDLNVIKLTQLFSRTEERGKEE